LLDPRRLRDEGYWDAAKVGHRWRQHKQGGVDHVASLWPILMFQAWKAAGTSAGGQPIARGERVMA
jgi:hypothetical protein